MKKLIVLFTAVTLLLGLCACTAAQLEGQNAEESQGPTWQEQYDLGVHYLSEGNYEEAILAFTAAIEIDPKQAPAYVGRGDAYMLSGETEANLTAARADYEMAIQLNEALAEAYLGLADVYIRQGNKEKALEVLDKGYDITGDASLKEAIEQIDVQVAPPLNALGGTEFYSRTGYTEFDTLPTDAQNTIIALIAAVINNDENALSSFGSVSDETYFFFLPGRKYTSWNGYKISSKGMPYNRKPYTFDIEFRPESGMGYYCRADIFDSFYSIEISKCMCSNWNYNGDAVSTSIHCSNDGSLSTQFEYGKMVNGLREGTFTTISQDGNDAPHAASREFRDGRWVSSTTPSGETIEGDSSMIVGMLYYLNMDQNAVDQLVADDLFW